MEKILNFYRQEKLLEVCKLQSESLLDIWQSMHIYNYNTYM